MDFEDRNVYKDYIGIYVIRNKITNSVYVGQTRQKFIKRYFLHSYRSTLCQAGKPEGATTIP